MLRQLLQPRRHAGGAAPCAGARRLVVASSLVAVFAGCGSGLDEPRHAIDPRDAPAIMPRRVDIRAEEPALPDSEVFAGADPLEPLTPPQRVSINAVSSKGGTRAESIQTLQGSVEDLIQAGRYEEAHKLVRDARRDRPDDPKLLYLMAFAYFTEGDLNRAEPVLNRVLKLDSEHVSARKLLSALLTADGRCRAAVEQIESVIAGGDADAEAYTLRAAARLRCGDLSAAEQDATAALQRDPSWTRAFLVRCAARLRIGSIPAAREDLKAARKAGAPGNELQLLESELVKALSKSGR